MKKKSTTTKSQYSYMVTGILSAYIRNGVELDDEIVRKAFKASVYAFELISAHTDGIDEQEEDQQSVQDETVDYFACFPWKGKEVRYTDLEHWLVSQGVRSKGRISQIIKKSREDGLIIRNVLTSKYSRPNPETLKPCTP